MKIIRIKTSSKEVERRVRDVLKMDEKEEILFVNPSQVNVLGKLLKVLISNNEYQEVTFLQEELRAREEQILIEYMKDKPSVTTTELIKVVSLSRSVLLSKLHSLEEEGEISKIQKGKWRHKNAPEMKKEVKKQKENQHEKRQEETRSRILSYMKDKPFVTTTELMKVAGLSRSVLLSKLHTLEEEGEISKIQKGRWRHKDAPEMKREVKKQKEDQHEERQEEIRSKILSYMQDKPFVTTTELMKVAGLSRSVLLSKLHTLEEEGEISKIQKGKWRHKNAPEMKKEVKKQKEDQHEERQEEIRSKILSYMKDKPFVTTTELMKVAGLSRSVLLSKLHTLEEEGEISKIQKGKWRHKNAPEMKKEVKKQKENQHEKRQEETKNKILSYMKDKPFVTTTELMKVAGLSRSVLLSKLHTLEEEGEIFNVQKGRWRHKDAPEMKREVKKPKAYWDEKRQEETKNKILPYMQDKPFVTTTELMKVAGLSRSVLLMLLHTLEDEEEIFNVQKGKWRHKNAPEVQEEAKKEPKSINEELQKENEVMQLFERGWRITVEELMERFQMEEAEVKKILDRLVTQRKINQYTDGTFCKVKENADIFEIEKYKEILSFIMSSKTVNMYILGREFPNEAEEIVKMLEGKYLRYRPDSSTYLVLLNGRLTYFIYQKQKVTLAEIYKAFPKDDKAEIRRILDFLEEKRKIIRKGNIVMKM